VSTNGQASILLLDSEPVVRDVVSAILERAGHQVKATGDFEDAIEIMRTRPPDLVVTNVYLKGITGHDAMRRIRNEFPDLQVLMISGLPDDRTIRSWLGEDGFDTFPKPFTATALMEKVRQVLDGSA